ncbi:MAG: flagellar hook-basal body complex protein FliE [Bacilli bacterium]
MIQSVSSLNGLQASSGGAGVKTSVPQQSFGEMLSNAIGEVNNLQQQSDQKTLQLVKGEQVELHDVMISAQKSSVALQATIEVRNKMVEAYQEVMRMNI